MKLLTLIILMTAIVPWGIINSQSTTMALSIKDLSEMPVSDFKELFYTEFGVKKRVYFNCTDSAFSDNCVIKRKLNFNHAGNIVSDTSFIDTLYSSSNRIYSKNKIEIIKTHPEPGLFQYHYNTTVDSLILDSIQRPIRFYTAGIFTKVWFYDSFGRISNILEKPNDKYSGKKITYKYLPDSIIICSTSYSIKNFDTTFNYLVFDSLHRLISDKFLEKSVEFYAIDRDHVNFDSIIRIEPWHERSRTEYKYISDSIHRVEHYYDKALSFSQELLIINSRLQRIKMINVDGQILGQTIFDIQKGKEIKNVYQDGILIEIGENDFYSSGTLRCKSTISEFHNYRKYECYNKEGLIIQKTQITGGKVSENLICIKLE